MSADMRTPFAALPQGTLHLIAVPGQIKENKEVRKQAS
jgi:hypothetical protein